MCPDINPSIPIVGQPNSSEEPKVVNALTQLVGAVNNVDSDQIADGTIAAGDISSSLADFLALTVAGTTRRGKAIIPAAEGMTNSAYSYLATPDRVSSIVLPTDGLICVAYQALWRETVPNAGRAALFLGATQLVLSRAGGGVAVQETSNNGAANVYTPLTSAPGGLLSPPAVTADASNVTTGQIVGNANTSPFGGFVSLFAAAGTYDVGVKFKASAGTVTIADRRLWVWTIAF